MKSHSKTHSKFDLKSHSWNFGRSIFFVCVALVAAVIVDQVVGCLSAPAQSPLPPRASSRTVSTPSPVDALLQQMVQSAAIIFVGKVLGVRRPAGGAGSAEDAAGGVVEVDFHVDQAVRGSTSGSTYTLREWAGLWVGGTDRYLPGQRLLMMLRQPDTAGLTSPVHGAEGAIPLRGIGAAPGPDDAFPAAPAQWMVDVRWLEAQRSRTSFTPIVPGRTLPVRDGGGRFHSELEQADSTQSLMIPALPGPWVEQSASSPGVELLSHVLEICTSPLEMSNAKR